MHRTKIVAANWKMEKSLADTAAYCKRLRVVAQEIVGPQIIIFPPFLAIRAAVLALDGTSVSVGAQDLFWEKRGAFTGEVSAAMIVDAGATHVLVGHSERRHVIGEDNDAVARKLHAALEAGLVPVFCVGERLTDREHGAAEAYVLDQLESALGSLTREAVGKTTVAYEPVWAIGTGRTATPDDAESMHRFVREFLRKRFGPELAGRTAVLYGGSVKPDNAPSLLSRDEIDGALVGGASLDVESFAAIVRAAL
jgi:triosephosphate isomerase